MSRIETRIVTPTVSVGAYSANDGVGGIITIPNAVRGFRSAWLHSVQLLDRSAQSVELDCILFSRTPVGGTYTDNGALALSAADANNISADVVILAANYRTVVTGLTLATAAFAKPYPIKTLGTDLFMLVKTVGTPTYALGALTFIFGFEQD